MNTPFYSKDFFPLAVNCPGGEIRRDELSSVRISIGMSFSRGWNNFRDGMIFPGMSLFGVEISINLYFIVP